MSAKNSLYTDAIRRFKKNKMAIIGFFIVAGLVFVALFADCIANSKPILVVSQNAVAMPALFTWPLYIKYKGENFYPIFIGSKFRQIVKEEKKVKIDPMQILAYYGGKIKFKIMPPIPYYYDDVNLDEVRQFCSKKHLLGTDEKGRDILARIIHGSRVSLMVAIVSQAIAIFIGIVLGLVAGYYGGWIDNLIMRITDIVFAFPFLLFVMAITSVIRPGIDVVFVAMGLVGWPSYARLVRAQVLSVKELEYIQAAKVIGLSDFRILAVHVFPNVLAPIIVQLSLGMAGAILAEAGLSFLGLGAQPPTPSWGLMIHSAQTDIDPYWWLAIFPGIAIAITVLGFNMFGDGLRDALDPKMKGVV